MKRVVIVGGGITGLAAAHALESAPTRHEVRLFEASDHLGGNLVTLRHNGFILDGGPDSWLATKPHASRLAKDVGLSDELIGTKPDTRKVYIVWNRQLHPLPEGVTLGVPTEWRPFAQTALLDLDAKLRVLLEPLVPRKVFVGDSDESIGSFVRRRLGADIADRIAGPLLGGIFAGDPEDLSVRACLPQFVEAEAKHGSLVKAMRALGKARREQTMEGEGSTFVTLKRGIGDLVVNVAHRLRDAHVSTSCEVRGLEQLPHGDPRGRWVVRTAEGDLNSDHVILALPAHAAMHLLRACDPVLSEELGEIHSTTTATVFLGYRRFDVRHPLDAVGFIVPRAENRPILACTFVSSKWDHRAPAGQVLLRVFVGGQGNEHLAMRDDDALAAIAREQLLDLLGIDRPPSVVKVFRFPRATTLPKLGHLARMDRIFARVALLPGLHLGGNGYRGTGIPDAIRQGEEMAEAIAAEA